MPRLFVPQNQLPTITGSDVHYLRDVLRLKAGDQLELIDGTGKVYTAKISKLEKQAISCEIVSEKQSDVEPRVKVSLGQALPKARKMDFIVEKCVELGVAEIIPLTTERTIARLSKPGRWEKIAREAAEQSGRSVVPKILPLSSFKNILKIGHEFDLALLPWELEKENTLKKSLQSLLVHPQPRIIILIGPEGGFSNQEVDLAREAGFVTTSLGKRILRSETAGMAALSSIMYELD
jgi:16S rRNA (uracil1498-N3)-methyltransferase